MGFYRVQKMHGVDALNNKKKARKKQMLWKKIILTIAGAAVVVQTPGTALEHESYADIVAATENINTSVTSSISDDNMNLSEISDVNIVDASVDVAEFLNENTSSNLDDYDTDDYYTLKRIMVLTGDSNLDDTYNASDVIYYEDYGEYILQFETEADTEYAYYKLADEYGQDNCFVDQIVSTDILDSVNNITEYNSYSWGGSYMGMTYLKSEYDYYQIDTEVTVALIDTGVDTTNSIFDGRIDSAHSFYFYGSSSAIKSKDYEDENGHGTHVAGIIADNTPENVRLMILRTFDADGKSTNIGIRTAMQYAIDNGADVINMSLGWSGVTWQNSTLLDDVISQAKQKGVIICCASGNNAADAKYTYPANQEDVITVSAVNSNSTFAVSYSNYGDDVDYCAPGTEILSTYLGGRTYKMSGTSMATPHVTAAVAYVKMLNKDAKLSKVKSILNNYSVDLGGEGWDEYYGQGYINLKSYFDDAGLEERYTDINASGEQKQEPATSFKKEIVTKAYGSKSFINTIKTESTGFITYSSDNKNVAKVDAYGRVEIVSVGTCIITAVVDADKTYAGTTISYVLVVNPIDISSKKITLSKTSYTYTGKKCKPTVKVSGVSSENYTVTYKNAKAIGTATVIVKGCGNYGGTCKLTYTIKPSKVVAESIYNNAKGIKLTWKNVAGNPGYRVYRKTSGSKWTKIADVTAGKKSYTDKTAKSGVVYYYTVRAVSGKMVGKYSTIMTMVRVKTPKATLTSYTSDISVSWKKIAKASGYQIQYSTNSAFKNAKKIKVSGGKNISYRISGLESGKKYYVRVRAYKKVNGKLYYSSWSKKVGAGLKN